MKINRMLEIIIILITEGEVKAKDLAERFNCTTKTIYRDVEYIKEAGIPIISEKGRNGGFKIGSEVSKNEGRISLKEQHTIINTLKNHGSISEEQLEKIMTTIEGLFKESKDDWIAVEFSDPERNEILSRIKKAIIEGNIIKLSIKVDEDKTRVIKLKPHKIIMKDMDIYLRYYDLEANKLDEIYLHNIIDIEVKEGKFQEIAGS